MPLLSRAKPAPQAAPVVVPEKADDNYKALATKLGLRVVVAQTEFVEFLAAEGIPTYDADEVHKWLKAKSDKQTKRAGTHVYYGWLPLRQADLNKAYTDGTSMASMGLLTQDGGLVKSVYSKPVPYPVLLTVEKLVNKFGNQVSFWVSEIAKELDPFLMVIAPDGSRWIIERWDEPGFRGSK